MSKYSFNQKMMLYSNEWTSFKMKMHTTNVYPYSLSLERVLVVEYVWNNKRVTDMSYSFLCHWSLSPLHWYENHKMLYRPTKRKMYYFYFVYIIIIIMFFYFYWLFINENKQLIEQCVRNPAMKDCIIVWSFDKWKIIEI